MLTDRIQIQAIADHLNGLETLANPDFFQGIYAECWQAIKDKDSKESKLAALGLVLNAFERPEAAEVLRQILGTKPGEGAIKPLADIKGSIAPIEWLWDGWIPRGLLSILAAAPGVGKTGLMLDLARRITNHDETWPDGKSIPNPRSNVLYIDAEGAPEVIKERAEGWRINEQRFFLQYPRLGEFFDFGSEGYQERIYGWMRSCKPELIIIDSLGSINLKGENNIEDVRKILSFLIMLARDSKAGFLLIHHLRKVPGNIVRAAELTVDDLRGSSHIVASARVILGLSVIQSKQEFDPNGPRKLYTIKKNIGPHPKPLGYEVVPAYPQGFTLKWGDAPKMYHEPDKTDQCAEWLTDILQERPLSLKELTKLGQMENFSQGTIIRAKQRYPTLFLDTKSKHDPGNMWRLAANEAN